jgi:sugar lactone lactonase YvrE
MKSIYTFRLLLCLFLSLHFISTTTAQPLTAVIPMNSFFVENPVETDGDLWIKGPSDDPNANDAAYSKLSFDLSILPQEVEILSCSLRLYIRRSPSREVSVRLMHLLANSSEKQVASVFLAEAKAGDAILLTSRNPRHFADELKAARKRGLSFDLKLMTDSDKEARISFSSSSQETPESIQEGLLPRLIVRYTHKSSPRKVAWAGLNGDAQHSGAIAQRFYGGVPRDLEVTEVRDLKDIKTELVAYKNLLYALGGPAGYDNIYGIDPFNKGVSWYTAVPGTTGNCPPAQMPVIDPMGKLYYFCTDKNVYCYDLEGKDTTTHFTLTSNLEAPPTAGPDGRMYFATEGYIFAYSPYPQHRLIWRYSIGEATPSSVALNADGSIAYVVLENANDDRIEALDTNTGDLINSRDSIDIKEFGEDKHSGTTIPVVDEKGNVFVTDKFPIGNRMYVFAPALEKVVTTLSGENFSKPVGGKKGPVYYVKDSNLYCYDSEKETRLVNSPSPDLEKVTNMLVDGNNNVYCLNKDQKKLVVFDRDGRPLYNLSDNTLAKFDKGILITPDGSIYCAGRNKIYSIRPKSFDPGEFSIDKNSIKGKQKNATFRAQKLTIGYAGGDSLAYPKNYEQIMVGWNAVQVQPNVSLQDSSDLTIISDGFIAFKNGFRVKKGARLRCKMASAAPSETTLPFKLRVGMAHAGGLIFKLNPDGVTGLVVAKNDIDSTGWNAARARCAQYTEGGYTDWRLPTRQELRIMYTGLHQQGLGDFLEFYYWTSEEYTANGYFYAYSFKGNVANAYLNSVLLFVRPVRAF